MTAAKQPSSKRGSMDRAELEATAKEAIEHMGIDGVISFLLDWCERAFYETMAHDLIDEAVAAGAIEAAHIAKVR